MIINAGTIINDGEKVAENIDLVGTPAWSLGALLTKALPNVFEDGNYRHVLTIQYVHGATEDRVWDMRYEDILTGMFIHDIDAPHPIEACVRMVEKLKEKGRI